MYNSITEVNDIMLDNYKKEIEKVSNMDEIHFKMWVSDTENAKRSERTLGYLISLEKSIMQNINNLNHDLEKLHDVIASYHNDCYYSEEITQ